MIKVVFLVSGGGGTLRFFYFAVKTLGLPFNLVGIISDRECDALKYGRAIGVASYVIPYSKNDDTALNDVLSEINPDCVVTNFHKVPLLIYFYSEPNGSCLFNDSKASQDHGIFSATIFAISSA